MKLVRERKFYLDEETEKMLEELAKETKEPYSVIVRQAIRYYYFYHKIVRWGH